MRTVKVHVKSLSKYTQSRMHHTPKIEKESADAYEARTWLEKTTTNDKGEIIIPAVSFKQSLDRAGQMLGMQIPGRGKSTYTKHFKAGIMIVDDLNTGWKKEEVTKIAINAHSDGTGASGNRVVRFLPQIPSWEGTIEFKIVDDTITPEVFEKHFTEAGMLVGIGQHRPENGGNNGRFMPMSFDWS
jgi:hypothetical protein